MPDVGEDAKLTLTVDPHDATTAASVGVTSPSGVTSTLTPVTADDGATWTAYLPLTEAGAWRVLWTVTGQGAGVQPDTVYAFTPVPDQPAYATLSDLAGWMRTDPPEAADVLLPAAKRRLDWALIGARYDVDDDGMPTDPDVIAALRDASCAQVQWWDAQGDTTGSGTGADWADVTIGKVRLSRTASGASSASAQTKQPTLAPEAARILAVAGLLPINGVMVIG